MNDNSERSGWPIVHDSKLLAILWAILTLVVVSSIMIALSGAL